MLKLIRWCSIVCALLAMPAIAQAQSAYPDRPIRFVIAFPPGGATDTFFRLISNELATELGASIVIENKGGAGGYIAWQMVAASPADGYTVLVAENAIGINQALFKKHPSGFNPLIGVSGDDRFVSMTDAYDKGLRKTLARACLEEGIVAHEGVYMWFSGPSFETPAEIRMARLLGADLVGMSTVPEVILARRLGLKAAALSLVTNLGAGMLNASPSHGETKEIALAGAQGLQRLLRAFLRLHDDQIS